MRKAMSTLSLLAALAFSVGCGGSKNQDNAQGDGGTTASDGGDGGTTASDGGPLASELQFVLDSALTGTLTDGLTASGRLGTTIELSEHVAGVYSGTGVLQLSDFSVTPDAQHSDCSVTLDSFTPDPVEVTSVTFGSGYKDVTLKMKLLHAQEALTVCCKGICRGMPDQLMTGLFDSFHLSEISGDELVIQGWTPGDGHPIAASKTYSRNNLDGDLSASEETHLVLQLP